MYCRNKWRKTFVNMKLGQIHSLVSATDGKKDYTENNLENNITSVLEYLSYAKLKRDK